MDENTNVETPAEDQDDLDFTPEELGDVYEPVRDDKGRFTSATPAGEPADEPAGESVDEPSDTPADTPAAAETDDDGDDPANYKIRLAKAISQRDAARQQAQEREAEIARLRLSAVDPANKPKPKPDPIAEINTELDDLYVQLEDARYDGDRQAAAQLQREIDAKNQEIVEHRMTRVVDARVYGAREDAKLETMLDMAIASIPEMDQNSDDFDPVLIQTLQETAEGYERLGFAPSDALKKAVVLVYRADPFTKAAKKTSNAKPASEPSVSAAPAAKKPDVRTAVERGKRTPPDVNSSSTGLEPKSRGILEYDDEEFDALPKAVQDRLLGNTLS